MNADVKLSMELPAISDAVEHLVDKVAGEHTGFVLITFPFDRHGTMNYMSNAPRPEMHAALRQLVDKWDEGMPDIPYHKKN